MRLRRAAAAILALAALALGACGDATERVTMTVAEGPLLGPRWEQGMNVTAYVTGGFAGPRAQGALEALAATGATHVTFVPVWYQDNRFSADMDPVALKSPSDRGLRSAVKIARKLGLRIVIKPHVDLLDEGFRGDIDPVDVDAWFRSYRRFALHYAAIAAKLKADTFVVGTELVSMARRTARFRRIIAAVREVYDGELTYAANWVQDAEEIGFWDDLDSIGVDAYMPLTSSAAKDSTPTTRELVDAWKPYVRRLERLRENVGGDKPVRFTELGYAGRLGATHEPSSEDVGAPVDPAVQGVAYTAALRAWRTVPWFVGIWWWDWPLDGRAAGYADGSYTPRDTSAELVLRRWSGVSPRRDAGG